MRKPACMLDSVRKTNVSITDLLGDVAEHLCSLSRSFNTYMIWFESTYLLLRDGVCRYVLAVSTRRTGVSGHVVRVFPSQYIFLSSPPVHTFLASEERENGMARRLLRGLVLYIYPA